MRIYGNFKVERATLRDVPALTMLEYKLYEAEGIALDDKMRQKVLRDVMGALSNPDFAVLALTIQRHRKQRIVGMAGLRVVDSKRGRAAISGSFFIEPAFRDTEGAKLLIEHGEAAARELKADFLVADLTDMNLLEMVKKNGFKMTRAVIEKNLKEEVKANGEHSK